VPIILFEKFSKEKKELILASCDEDFKHWMLKR